MNDLEKPLLSREEAARILGIKPQTLAKWAHTGRSELRMIKVGSRARYRLSDIEDFIEKNSVF